MASQRFHRRARRLTLSGALEDYQLFQKAKGSDPKTVYMGGYAVKKLLAFLDEDPPVSELMPADMRSFMAETMSAPTRYGGPPKVQSVHTIYCKLRTFLRWCEEEGYLEENPMRRLPPPRLDRALLPALTAEELTALDRALQGKGRDAVRDRALVYTLLDSGVRLEECADLMASDLDLRTGALTVRLGKGRKGRVSHVGSTTLRAIGKYLREWDVSPDGPLWLGRRGPLTRSGIRSVLDDLTERTGIHVHAHKLRRTMALQMLRNGCDVYSLQHLMGHAELDTLRRYLAQTEADVSKAHERFGVLDRLPRRGKG